MSSETASTSARLEPMVSRAGDQSAPILAELERVTPDARNNGQFQFASQYLGGFSMAYAHLSFADVEERLQRHHPGVPSLLIDDGTDLVLVSTEPVSEAG